MKIALCLTGILGGSKGKAGDKSGDSKQILNLAYPHFQRHILSQNDVDVFIHSYDVDLEEDIRAVFKPKASVFEEETLTYDIPAHLDNTKRVQQHFSRWNSIQEAVRLQDFFSKSFDTKYDLVMVSRFDLAWVKDVDFSQLDPNYFYVANWFQHHNSEPMGYPNGQYAKSLQDCWFIASPEKMLEFSNIYDDIPQFTLENKELSAYKGISNHRLAFYKIQKMGMLSKLRFAFRYDVPEFNDFPLVRWKYFNDRT
jgi:hypothetical protein